jgi:hypothetical protein
MEQQSMGFGADSGTGLEPIAEEPDMADDGGWSVGENIGFHGEGLVMPPLCSLSA